MLDVFTRVVAEADDRGEYISSSQLEDLHVFVSEGKDRMEIVNRITSNASYIVANAARILFAEQPQLIKPGGNAYPSRRLAACLRDLEVILRYITYAMFAGDSSVLDYRCLDGLRETYIALGTPCSSVAVGILKMKEITIELIVNPRQRIQQPDELSIREIRTSYSRQWVTIQVTQFKHGFPSKGRVLFYDTDIDKLTKKILHLSGDIYTFFTGIMKEERPQQSKPEPHKISNLAMISELSSYFDRAISTVT